MKKWKIVLLVILVIGLIPFSAHEDIKWELDGTEYQYEYYIHNAIFWGFWGIKTDVMIKNLRNKWVFGVPGYKLQEEWHLPRIELSHNLYRPNNFRVDVFGYGWSHNFYGAE